MGANFHRFIYTVKFFGILFSINLLSCYYFTREPGIPPKINGVPIPDAQRTIYVYNFSNSSYAPALHTLLTQFLIQEINKRGRFIQTRDKDKAAYKVAGDIVHYQKVGDLMDLGDQHLSSEIFTVARIDFWNATTGERLAMERQEIPGRAFFSSQLGYRETESQAQERMARVMAVKIAEELEKAWYFSIAKNIEE